MSSGGSSFSDDSLRDALVREAGDVTASPQLRNQVSELFVSPPVVKIGGTSLTTVAITSLIVTVLVGIASYQIYDTFFYSPASINRSPDWAWENIANMPGHEGASNPDIDQLIRSLTVPVATLNDPSAKLINATTIETACSDPISPVIDYSIGKDQIRIITASASASLATREGATEFQKVFNNRQVVAILRDNTWVIAVADKNVPTQKLVDILRTASVSKSGTLTNPPTIK